MQRLWIEISNGMANFSTFPQLLPMRYSMHHNRLPLCLRKEGGIHLGRARDPQERSVVRIEKGMYMGFGYISIDEGYLEVEQMMDCIKPALDNRDIRQILKNWLKKNHVEKMLYY